MTTPTLVEAAVAACLARLPAPGPPPENKPWMAHSLTRGAAGIALAHIEHAHQGTGSWPAAHAWIVQACAGQVSAGSNTGLFQGLPAVAFLLHATGGRYRGGLADLARPLADLVHQRAGDAHARITAGQLAEFREYDVFFGLTGLGALLLRLDPGGGALEHLLTALVALTRPLRLDGVWLPGWWVGHDPHRRRSTEFPGGHANLGMAHGITGPLALLAQAMRAGITVDRHADAIHGICAFLDTWRQDTDTGPWWPQWITLDDLCTGRPSQPGPARPSWCYGTPGIARAQQLAAIATGDPHRRHIAEHALATCLADPAQLGQIIDASLCHGWAGLYQTAARAARDALTSQISERLPHLTEMLIHHATAAPCRVSGLLEGQAGLALALHTAAHAEPPISGWDTCLMIN